MRTWTEDELILEGYTIKNAIIKKADLTMQDHGCITLNLKVEGDGWGCIYGGLNLGEGYLGAENFVSTDKTMPYLMRIMDTIGVDSFSNLSNQYCRIAFKYGEVVTIIGNITTNKWFDQKSFFEQDEIELDHDNAEDFESIMTDLTIENEENFDSAVVETVAEDEVEIIEE